MQINKAKLQSPARGLSALVFLCCCLETGGGEWTSPPQVLPWPLPPGPGMAVRPGPLLFPALSSTSSQPPSPTQANSSSQMAVVPAAGGGLTVSGHVQRAAGT